MDHSSLQHHHHQEMMGSDESLESMLVHTKTGSEGQRQVQVEGQGQEQVEEQDQKKPRPPEEVQKCPRCDSTNTKFCYYNNYSLSQPRYFCKSCRRYWTKGGTLRNVPVGGGCRKNRRSSSSSSSSSASRRSTPDHHLMISTTNHPSSSSSPPPNLFSPYENLHHHSLLTNDLTLAFARLQKHGGGFDHHGNIPILGNSHFDLFGNSFVDPQTNNASSSTLQHLYYGGLVGDAEHTEGSIVNQHQQMASMQFDPAHYHQNNQEMMSNPSSGSSTPTTIKQETRENKVLWGLPWQISSNGGEGNYMNAAAAIAGGAAAGGGGNNEFGVSLKESWNNVGHVLNPTNWHSLLNSPLM